MDKTSIQNLKIEEAKKEEGDDAKILMQLAFDEFSHVLFGTDDEVKILKYFKELWEDQKNRFSSKYCYVVRNNNTPIALLSCMEGRLIDSLLISSFMSVLRVHPEIILYILRHPNYLYKLLNTLEATNDELYIFMLAVSPEFQSKGIGAKLLEFAEVKAKEKNLKKCSLLVRIKNERAIKFYERNGYEKVAIYNKKPMEFYRMVKLLK